MEHVRAFFNVPGAGLLALGVASILLLAGGRKAVQPLLLGGLAGTAAGLVAGIVFALLVGLVGREVGIPPVLAPLVGLAVLLAQWLGPAAGLVVGYRAFAEEDRA